MSRPAASADIFQAIADPTRRAILNRLRAGEQPVKQLAEPFEMSLPAISQHLQILCNAGLVSQQKAGRQRLYRLNPVPLQQVSEWVAHCEPFWQQKLDALGAYLEENPLQSVGEKLTMENKTIENLEEKLRHAMLNSNVPVLDELIADDLVWIIHTGQVVDKQFDLEAHRSGFFRFTKLDISDRQIHPYGDCVVVTLKAEIAGTHDGHNLSETYRFTRVWLQRQNRWQVVAGHVSQVGFS